MCISWFFIFFVTVNKPQHTRQTPQTLFVAMASLTDTLKFKFLDDSINQTRVSTLVAAITALVIWIGSTSACAAYFGSIDSDGNSDADVKALAANAQRTQIGLLVAAIVVAVAFAIGVYFAWKGEKWASTVCFYTAALAVVLSTISSCMSLINASPIGIIASGDTVASIVIAGWVSFALNILFIIAMVIWTVFQVKAEQK